MTDDSLTRAQGALIGVHLGDSLGATWEFKSRTSLLRKDVQKKVGKMLGGGPFKWEPGAPTDDTDQTLIVARALIRDCAPTADITHDLIRWSKTAKDVGTTTSAALRARASKTEMPYSVQMSEANGALMRIAPVGIAYKPGRLLDAAANAITSITHPSMICRSISRQYATMLSNEIDGHQQVLGAPGPHPRSWYEKGRTYTQGSCLSSMRIAEWAIASVNTGAFTPFEALRQVILLGGDTDTNGAIAGGLLGAVFGIDAWPTDLVDQLRDGKLCLTYASALLVRRNAE